MKSGISVVAHNLDFGGAATACKRLVFAYENLNLNVTKYLVSNRNEAISRFSLKNFFKLRSAIISRLDSTVCKFLEKNKEHWCSSGMLGQISASKIEKSKPMFVNIHWVGHATISLRQIARLNSPVVITAHDEWWLNAYSHYSTQSQGEHYGQFAKFARAKVIKHKVDILRKANVGVVCLSEEMKNKFLSQYPFLTERIAVIPNPVNADIFYPRDSTNSASSTRIVAYLGGFSDKRKGYDLLLEALTQSEEEFIVSAPGFDGVLITGKYNQIKVVGMPRITNENEMNDLFNTAEVTVVPSRKEALPQVATESLMAGTPVVSFHVGGLIDIVINEVSGFKVDNFDTMKLALTIDHCINSLVKKKMQPQHFAEKLFSNTIVGEAYLAFSKRLFSE